MNASAEREQNRGRGIGGFCRMWWGSSRNTRDLPWALTPTVAFAGQGIPFSEKAIAGVVHFMSRLEGEMPPSDDYGGTGGVGGSGELSGGMNGLASADNYATQHQMYVHGMTLLQGIRKGC